MNLSMQMQVLYIFGFMILGSPRKPARVSSCIQALLALYLFRISRRDYLVILAKYNIQRVWCFWGKLQARLLFLYDF